MTQAADDSTVVETQKNRLGRKDVEVEESAGCFD
jgi:hypothetical protein